MVVGSFSLRTNISHDFNLEKKQFHGIQDFISGERTLCQDRTISGNLRLKYGIRTFLEDLGLI